MVCHQDVTYYSIPLAADGSIPHIRQPKNKGSMTVRQYQELCDIVTQHEDEVDRVAYSICYLYDFTPHEVNIMSRRRFNRYCRKLKRDQDIRPPMFQRLRFEVDATKITAGQLLECIRWIELGSVYNLHKIAASILIKRTNHKKDADRMLKQDIRQVYPQVVKFIESFHNLFQRFKWLFEDGKDDDETPKKAHSFIRNFGWIFSAKQVSEHLGLNLNQTYDISAVEFLNSLVYIKAQSQYEQWVSKKK